MNKMLATLFLVATTLISPIAIAQSDKPTVVLVHGAFAESSSWNGVAAILRKQGYPVVALANPLRSVKTDARYLGDVLATIKTPVVLVGHSYGGMVISEAAGSAPNVMALVYVAAFAPEPGESAVALSGKFPGSTLGAALAPPVPLSGGGNDLYIAQGKFHDQFAADVAPAETVLMAATQRPATEAALNEPASEAAWKKIPSWFIHGEKDRNIPLAVLDFMAERAKSRKTVVVPGASHVVMVSHPEAVAGLIATAAKSE
ncbi:MAG: alpha/beta hydrolase [Pseudoxanthomonas sp.]